MPDVTVNVEVFCAKCGAGLCNQTTSTTTRHREQPEFQVEPCERCLDKAREEADSEGYDRGRAEFKEE